jgi:ribosomal protein S18 acetylase RimI-like enzyme
VAVPADVTIRAAMPADFDRIVAVADQWWGRPMTGVLQRLFLDHFHDTSLVADSSAAHSPGTLAGFVVGFFSAADPTQAYIHFTGVHPNDRRAGLATELYERFFAMARLAGRSRVHAITSPQNEQSIAFHRRLGFTVSAPISNYDGPDRDRVTFERHL